MPTPDKTHSPLPWRIDKEKDPYDDTHIRDASGKSLFCDATYYPWVSTPDFPYIVQAVNTHAALVRALKLAVLSLDSLMNGDENDYDAHEKEIKETLRLAGETV